MKKFKLFSILILIQFCLFISNVSATEEVEVPNTLSGNSALLLATAMFDIALGIGVITYVRKNKVKE